MIFKNFPYSLYGQVLSSLSVDDYLNLRLVNKECYESVTPLLYRDIHCFPSSSPLPRNQFIREDKFSILIDTLLRNKNLLRFVKSLVVSISLSKVQEEKLKSVISGCSNLQRLTVPFPLKGPFSVSNIETRNPIENTAVIKELVINKAISISELTYEFEIEKLFIHETNYKWVNTFLRYLMDRNAFDVKEVEVRLTMGDQIHEFVQIINKLMNSKVSVQFYIDECIDSLFLSAISAIDISDIKRLAIIYNGPDFNLVITNLLCKINWNFTRVFLHINDSVAPGELCIYEDLPITLSIEKWERYMDLGDYLDLKNLDGFELNEQNPVAKKQVAIWNRKFRLGEGYPRLWNLN